jgi:hypothetical protein
MIISKPPRNPEDVAELNILHGERMGINLALSLVSALQEQYENEWKEMLHENEQVVGTPEPDDGDGWG